MSPSCILLATSAQDVSKALKVLVPLSCKFAVRSGGHGAVPGVSNIQNGVTIDLRGLNGIALSKDKSTVDLGPGQTWGSVYTQLQASGVTVSGARGGSIGVGGSTLGGKLICVQSPRCYLEEHLLTHETNEKKTCLLYSFQLT